MKYILAIILFGSPLMPLLAKSLPLEIIQKKAKELDSTFSAKQKALKIEPTAIIDDATFLRRTYLNIIGRLPSHDEAKSFLDSSIPEKRSHLIETLVQSPGIETQLFNLWSDLLRIQTRKESFSAGWHVWLRKAVKDNMPYHEMVNKMLSAKGHAAENPAVGYYLRDRNMLLDNVSNTVQVFLGQQIGCAQCHDHPFDTYTQMEYYQMAAFLGDTEYRFAGAREKVKDALGLTFTNRDEMMGGSITSKKENRNLKKKNRAAIKKASDISSVFKYYHRNTISENHQKELSLPEDYQYEDGNPGERIKPQFLFGKNTGDVPPEKRRQVFADWVTDSSNPYFTKVIANRLWHHAFGHGLVSPLDDWSQAPDSKYPDVIQLIEKAMKAVNYNTRDFLRILYHSDLFQRAATVEAPQSGFAFDFSGPALRRMKAEEIRDSLVTLNSGVVDKNHNGAIEKAWNSYVESHQFLLNADKEQLIAINQGNDKNKVAFLKLNKEHTLLKTTLKKLKDEDGEPAKINQIQKELRQIKAKQKSAYQNNMSDELIKKVAPATRRRIGIGKADYPIFELRSSELPAPSLGNSLAREFGGSDRETPDSSHPHATIPQSLRLLNGQEVNFRSKKNKFVQKFSKLDSAEERLNYLFLSLYSAYPTEEERTALLPEVNDLNKATTLARAILTSNRFLFVQ